MEISILLRIFKINFLFQITNFLTYQGIIAACESYLQRLSFQHLPSKKKQPLRSKSIQVITKDAKGCRSIYDIL